MLGKSGKLRPQQLWVVIIGIDQHQYSVDIRIKRGSKGSHLRWELV